RCATRCGRSVLGAAEHRRRQRLDVRHRHRDRHPATPASTSEPPRATNQQPARRRLTMTIHLHGARPVPVSGSAPTRWDDNALDDTGELTLRALAAPVAAARVPDDYREVVQMALGPLRQWATVPVVGIEGGAGRTTVTY